MSVFLDSLSSLIHMYQINSEEILEKAAKIVKNQKLQKATQKQFFDPISKFYFSIDAIVSDRCVTIVQPRWTPDILKMRETTDL